MTTDATAPPNAPETVSFDHNSTEYAQRWREQYGELRQRCPVAHSDAYGGFTVLTRYADVERAVKDDATFASRHIAEEGSPFGGIIIPPSPMVSIPIEMDPPEYTPYRKVLNPWFSPARSKSYEPFLRSVTTALIDEVIERGEIDLVQDLSSPVPALLTARVLGVPLVDWRLYSEAAHGIPANTAGHPGVRRGDQQDDGRAGALLHHRPGAAR